MKRVFERIAPEYPNIESSHLIIDNCAHQLVIAPEQFGVIVTSNMNGDIISDLAAGLVGGLGIAPSANLGSEAAMFEAVHGSAPQIAGLGLANPTALLLSAVMMLRFIGDFETAEHVEQAVYVTLEEGRSLTNDLAPKGTGVTTEIYTDEVIANLGRRSVVPSRLYKKLPLRRSPQVTWHREPSERESIGVDVFLESDLATDALAGSLKALCEGSPFELRMISNRGGQIWPQTAGTPFLVDHFLCRFTYRKSLGGNDTGDILELLRRIGNRHRWMHIEKLQRFDGTDAFARAQGEE